MALSSGANRGELWRIRRSWMVVLCAAGLLFRTSGCAGIDSDVKMKEPGWSRGGGQMWSRHDASENDEFVVIFGVQNESCLIY